MDKRKIQRFVGGIAALVMSSMFAVSEPAAAQGQIGALARNGEPVPVSVVGPNEEPFSKWAAPVLNFDVPADKQLVIELVTGTFYTNELHAYIRVVITTGAEQVAHIIAPKVRLPGSSTLFAAFIATEQVKISAAPGANIQVYWPPTLPGQGSPEVSVAGYYVAIQ